MTSIYEKELGDDFSKLHPLLQKKFSLFSESGQYAIGRGTMTLIEGGIFLLKPLFLLATKRNLLFPERGENVPFSIINFAYKDPYGRETVSWVRRFGFPKKTRAFDATMVYSEKRKGIIDYLGNRQGLVSPLFFRVTKTGGLEITSDRAYFVYKGKRVVAPKWASPYATICEEVNKENGEITIHVLVEHPVFGKLVEYKGSFKLSFATLSELKNIDSLYPVRYSEQE
ncbi:DUF4166 domain-containing protein [Evansella sp. AB-rgal1]|uniref:DUF4166 domain-containing protein n=1 Tax=Evansella sp. AB-rgal1 TaxID=3242696 RepID=UPI00359DA9F6